MTYSAHRARAGKAGSAVPSVVFAFSGERVRQAANVAGIVVLGTRHIERIGMLSNIG